MSAAAPTVLPAISAKLPGVQSGRVSGFRDHEAWGRRTLSKVATLELGDRQSGWVAAHVRVALPHPRRTLSLWLALPLWQGRNQRHRAARGAAAQNQLAPGTQRCQPGERPPTPAGGPTTR